MASEFNPGDRVWQKSHAKDGYRFNILDEYYAANGEICYVTQIVGAVHMVVGYLDDGTMVRKAIGVTPIANGETVDIWCESLALATD